LVGLSILIFVLARVIPGDPVRLALGPYAVEEQVQFMRHRLGLDRPLPVQYLMYIRNVFQGQLGESLRTHRDVAADVRQYLPATVELTAVSMLIAVLVGIPLGVISALYKDHLPDHLSRIVALSAVALPRFWLAILLQLLVAFHLGWLPAIDRASIPPRLITGFYLLDSVLTQDWRALWDALTHLLLPAFALSVGTAAQVMRLVRSSMIEEMRKEYILAAVSYGLPKFVVVYKYMLRNALTSTITILGLVYGFLLANAFVVEVVFAWPGLASYGVQALLFKDFNAVVAVTLVVGTIYVVVNLFIDLMYAFLDPRVRYEG
jgi:peptide/nickel transport system permease protein